jgi:hypothetical protein
MNGLRQSRIGFLLHFVPLIVLSLLQFEYKDLVITPVAYFTCFGLIWYVAGRNTFRVAHFYWSNGFDLRQDALLGLKCINETMAIGMAQRDQKSIGAVHVRIQLFYLGVMSYLGVLFSWFLLERRLQYVSLLSSVFDM